MDDLSDSFFFDKNILKIVDKLLSNSKVSPINKKEQIVIENKNNIIELNDKMHYSLISSINKYIDFVPVYDCIMFLIFSMKKEKLSTAEEILNGALKEKQEMNFDTLLESLKNSESLPPSMTSLLYGEATDGRNAREYKPKAKNETSLDLERLKNFK